MADKDAARLAESVAQLSARFDRLETLVESLSECSVKRGKPAVGQFTVTAAGESENAGRGLVEVDEQRLPTQSAVCGPYSELQSKFRAIKERVAKVKLPSDLVVGDSRAGVSRSDLPKFNLIQKSARFQETVLKLLSTCEASDPSLSSITTVALAHLRYLQEEYTQLLMHEPYSINMDLSGLNNDELSHQLRSLGVNPGPIVGSTRRLYEKKLASLLSAGRPDGPAVPPQRQMADDGQMAADAGSAVRRRLGGGADGGERHLAGLDPNSPALRPVFLRDETDQPSPRRAVSDLREMSGLVRDVSAAQLNSSRSGAACEPECEEELRPWVRQFIKLCIILALVAAGYFVYQNGADWPAVRYIQEAARAAPAPARPPLVAPPTAGVNN